MADNGPYETAEQVRRLPAVRAVYEAMHAQGPQRGAGQGECERLIRGACERAGVTLGAYDERIVRWLAGWEPETCAVIAGLITRAGLPEPGTVTEWGVRYQRAPELPGDAPAVLVDRAADREEVLRMLADPGRRHALPGSDELVRRETGPWKEVPDA